MEFQLLWAAAALCVCSASAGILPASTQIFLPAASPAPSYVYLDQTQQQESLTAHPPLAYQLSLAYPGSPTTASPIATSGNFAGIGGSNVPHESVSSRTGDRISSVPLERSQGIERQRGQQQVQQRQRVDYIVNEVGRREGASDGHGRQTQNQQQQQRQQIAQQQAFQQQNFAQQLQQQQQQQQQQKQRYDFGTNEATYGATISGDNRQENAETSNLDLQRPLEGIQNRNRGTFVADQRGSQQRQQVDPNAHRRPDISSLTLSLQRQGHGSFTAGSPRSQIPGSLSIQRQESQTEQRIAFQGVGVEAEAARFQQRQREQQAANARVSGPSASSFEDATAGSFPTVLPTLTPTVAAVTGHGLQPVNPTESGFSSYSVQFVSPQFGYGYYGDQHSLQQQSSILVRSSLDGGLSSNAVASSGDLVGKH